MKEYIKIGVTGKNPQLWEQLRTKLLLTINKFLDIVIDDKKQSTIRDEAKEFASALLEFGKAKLASPVFQNEKLKAEIKMIYAALETEKANARKINAEAQKIEFNNAIKSLKVALSGIKIFMTGQEDEENILFLKNIDAFLPLLDSLDKD